MQAGGVMSGQARALGTVARLSLAAAIEGTGWASVASQRGHSGTQRHAGLIEMPVGFETRGGDETDLAARGVRFYCRSVGRRSCGSWRLA